LFEAKRGDPDFESEGELRTGGEDETQEANGLLEFKVDY